MKLRSQALRTDLIFNRFAGEVIDRGEYLVVKTDSRPKYFWGNYLIMNCPPKNGDLHRWIGLFEREIGPIKERGFAAITWDSINGEQGMIQPFLDFDFSINKSIILTARNVHRPPKSNPKITVRPLKSEEDWNRFIDIHFSPNWGYGEGSQIPFLKSERNYLRSMAKSRGLTVRIRKNFISC